MSPTDRNSSGQSHGTGSPYASQLANGTSPGSSKPNAPYWRIWAFAAIFMIDAVFSLLALTPLLSWVRNHLGERWDGGQMHRFAFYQSLTDLAALAAARILFSIGGLIMAFLKSEAMPEFPFEMHHPNGDRKSREELQQEALEEPFAKWICRFVQSPIFLGELAAVATQVVCIIKCLVRLKVEIDTLKGLEPRRPLFWLAVLLTTALSTLEAAYLRDACKFACRRGAEQQWTVNAFLRRSTEALPLLSGQQSLGQDCYDIEEGATTARQATDENTVDDNSKGKWTDLVTVCYPDLHLICLAFVFLLLAAVAETFVPKFLGKVLDSLRANYNKEDDGSNHKSVVDLPGFTDNIKLLVLASMVGGILSGLRGSIFTIVGGRVNVRLRVKLMDALLAQEIGFFDVTETGDITSRLSSDTTLVGDQITQNVNILLRSLVQAVAVLVFMFLASWQLSILAFISIPLFTLLSEWYGSYLQTLTTLMQKKLADGNSVSEAALSSMRTVRAFNASEQELGEFEAYMYQYLALNNLSAIAYCGFAAFIMAVPQLVFAVVVFYGGLLVGNGDMTGGQLVSFLLYLQSLSGSCSTVGWRFSSLMQAVGAADKVCELLRRKPRITPSRATGPASTSTLCRTRLLGIDAPHTLHQQKLGLRPEQCRGEIMFDKVNLVYPARPERRVLNGLNLKVESGSVVALVGHSGGGKSSVMSLIQHLYEPSSGRVLIDGIEVRKLNPEWLSRNVSIVSQEPTLFARSIKANIMYGLEGTDKEPTQEQIEEAARLANAHEFILKMPQRYETEVGERGVQLSGGQKQRIAIARALVRRPKVLLLDEATSALDAESEHLVQQAIDNMLARGKGEEGVEGAVTVIIAAHRLSTVVGADRIFVIKDGRVVEEGSHAELAQHADGAYASLIRRQLEDHQKLKNG